MSDPIGFIGLGALGLPVATNLLESGHALRVYNRTASKAAPLVARGAHLATHPADVLTSGGVVATLVWDDAALESIVTSPQFLERLGAGGVHISMSTILPETASRLAALHAKHGSTYVEAPIFGRPEAAVARKLSIPVSGPKAAKDRIRPLLQAMGASGIFDFGESVGAAVAAKLAGNFLLISAARAMTEAYAMAAKNDVDLHALNAMLTTTLFPAPIYQAYGKRIAEGAPAMVSDIPLKDVGLLQSTARQAKVATPLADRLHEILESAKRGG